MILKAAIVVLGALAVYFGYRAVAAAQIYLRLRGPRLLVCPDTKEVVLVEVAAAAAALQATLDEPCLRVRNCSRWPMCRDCGQDCLRQVESRPPGLRFSEACRGS